MAFFFRGRQGLDFALNSLQTLHSTRACGVHAEEVVHENCPANVGGWSGSVITLVHEDTQRPCLRNFFAGFGSLRNSSLESADGNAVQQVVFPYPGLFLA